jgi:peroxiredoxin family protein
MARKLHIVCVSGTREKLQMASMIASVAAATGDEVSVFFSMNACQVLHQGQYGRGAGRRRIRQR